MYIRTAKFKILWEVSWSDLSTISCVNMQCQTDSRLEGNGIALVLRGGVMGPFLPIPEASTRMWLFKQISQYVLGCRPD